MTSATARRELAAAGIHDEKLAQAYLACRESNARHGRTYFAATLLLPPAKRPDVHALYAFARWVDDVVDEGTGPQSVAEQGRLIDEVQCLLTSPATADEIDRYPILAALRVSMNRWHIPEAYFVDFLASMRMDLTVTEYGTYPDLERYMWGSAAVIGLQMLPILSPVTGVDLATPYAIDLGIAFQLTNFIRDVGDDLRRGRIYLPMESLQAHGVDRARLERGVVDGPIRRLLVHEIARTRELYRSAHVGVRMLHPTSRDCVQTALKLYSGILDEVERSDYRVLDRRVAVGRSRRLAVAAPALLHAVGVRRELTRRA